MNPPSHAEPSSQLLPVRMLNEHAYCPRLFAMEWANGEWADSADTVQGRTVHRRVDTESRAVPDADADADGLRVGRSVLLGDDALGLVARIDLLEVEGDEAVPVDYKRGRPAPTEEGAWEPERVQVCAQGLLLRAHGYRCDRAVLYFAAAKQRIDVPFTDELIAATLRHRDEALAVAARAELPPPLVDSPKCPRCSLVGLCLPDEHQWLHGNVQKVRPLIPRREDGLPLYVQLQGGRIGKKQDEIAISDRDGEVQRVRIEEVSRLVVLGNVTVSAPLLAELAERDIPVAFHSHGGWYQGTFAPASGRNVIARIAQFQAASDPARCLLIARAIVASKIRNQRVLLRRNGSASKEDLLLMEECAVSAGNAVDAGTLLGLEGTAARVYFKWFATMVNGPLGERFDQEGRNRRPPRDPVNALLSFGYAVLTRELTQILHGVGLDPYVGFYHRPRYGRPSLALDVMEEFRPVIADSAVLTALNNGEVGADGFLTRPTGTALTEAGRRAFIRAIERRLGEEARHPVFDTRLSYRRILEVQARLLAKLVTGEIDAYPEYRIR